MKRRLSAVEHDDGPSSVKKRKIEETSDSEIQSAQLPSEIWEQILSLLSSNHIEEIKDIILGQRALSSASKEYFQLVIKTWRTISAKNWPKFYDTVMKSLTDEKFIACYSRLAIFSKTTLDPKLYEPKFVAQLCPLCDEEMAQSGPLDEISQCTNCLSKYGANIEWKLNTKEFFCEGCDEITPFHYFECDTCHRQFGQCCVKAFKQQREKYYGGDVNYCNECTLECAHCEDYLTFEDEKCYRCKLPQCEHCSSVRTCDIDVSDNEERSTEDNEEKKENDDDSSDSSVSSRSSEK